MKYGKKTWLIPDGYWESRSNGLYPSHESVCVINTAGQKAHITMTIYFEDRDKMEGFTSYCDAGRTHHIRMDKLKNIDGKSIPMDTPYAILLRSDVEIVVQYSRIMTSQAEMGLATTIAYPIE